MEHSSKLYGISLYQQKNIELRLEGRRSFDANALFVHAAPSYRNDTPYLSQIPCSWGAVYFPEHWLEFHAYLATRFAQTHFEIDFPVVPNVRSNRWTRSWKRYFIEMAYLQGYVMLYPNFPGSVSLSTNHLEIGSHVKDKPKKIYLRKRRLFNLPLMKAHDPENPSSGNINLLDMPGRDLPPWNSLPVLNLTGHLTTLATITNKGLARRDEISTCKNIESLRESREWFCMLKYSEQPSVIP